jgi:protein-L-isoaspartate(D-aspartate) O-methyltransferase
VQRLVKLVPAAAEGAPMMLHWLASADSESRYRRLREHMVERQSAGHACTPRVRAALRSVPRHVFAPSHLRDAAYQDTPLDIGHGQTMSQPLMVAMMLDALALRGHEHVLEIGTGSGYQAALLSHLAREVHTIEIIPALARAAARALRQTGCTNVTVIEADGRQGWPAADAEPRYDAIIVNAAATAVPASLLAQLRAGGCLIIPVGAGFFQNLLCVRKHEDAPCDAPDGAIEVEDRGLCAFTPLLDGRAVRESEHGSVEQQLHDVERACDDASELLARIDTRLDPGLLIRLRTALDETRQAVEAACTHLAVRRARFLAHLVERAATVLDLPA